MPSGQRTSLKREVRSLPAHERAEYQNLGRRGGSSASRKGVDLDAGRDHEHVVSEAQVQRDSPGRDGYPVGAPCRSPDGQADQWSGQQVVVLKEVPRAGRHRGDRGAHPPSHDDVRLEVAGKRPHLGSVGTEVGGREQGVAGSGAKLETAAPQREESKPALASRVGERPRRAG